MLAWSTRTRPGCTSAHPAIRDLAHSRGLHMGIEYKKKGANVALGPVVGSAERIAKGGRNWEGFTKDPYLSGILATESVRGL